jgi:septal ring factor EnvC (AmiA/AmiB activator)
MAVLASLPIGIISALGQTVPNPPPREESSFPSATSTENFGGQPASSALGRREADQIKRRDQELAAIRANQRKALENETRLKREIDAIGEDRRKLSQEVIETANRVRAVEEAITRAEERVILLDERERALRESVEARQTSIAEILAALQRVGRHPPPALLVRPEDALASLRSAMMLGAVVPEIRQEAQTLLSDLNELLLVRSSITGQRDDLEKDRARLGEQTLRLSLLIDQRQKQQAEIEKTLLAERQRVAQLAREAESLRELVAKLEASRNARQGAATGPDAGAGKKPPESRPDLATLNDPGRLAPAVAFASAKRQLPLPVNGVRIREFGASDGVGGSEKGLSIETRPGAQVTAPADGWVVYAGPFRNYGQLLILNAGGGYHVLLAGMERISVDLGQFVVTGEPVAVMGRKAQAATAVMAGSGQPVLYVEFRKDGIPVDPGPWWAASEVEKVRG